MKFTLEIELGDDAMQSPADVASALMYIAGEGSTLENLTKFRPDDAGTIWDINGNRVGKWEVSE